MSVDQAESGAWPVVPAAIPTSMRGVVFREFGGPDVLEEAELAVPELGPGEVLIRIGAVSIGRLLDLTARAGTHPYARFTLPHLLGADHAGTVVAMGSNVTGLQVGDRVAAFPSVTCGSCEACRADAAEDCPSLRIVGVHLPGAYCEYRTMPARNLTVVPDGISAPVAAALALSGPVAQNQLDRAGLCEGDWVLVQGAASALGSATAALAAHRGAQVIGTSRSAGKRERLAELGVNAALDPTVDGFVDEVLELTDGRGASIVVDNLGDPEIWQRSMDVLATRGRAVTSGAFLGGRVELNLMRLYSRSQRVIGVRTGNMTAARRLWAEVERGFRPVLDRTFPLAEAAAAHRYVEDSNNVGRVTLTPVDTSPVDTATEGTT